MSDLPPDWKPRYNIAPTQQAPVIIDQERPILKMMKWGLIPSNSAAVWFLRMDLLLRPYAGELQYYPVSPRLNSPAYDDPQCIAPVAAIIFHIYTLIKIDKFL